MPKAINAKELSRFLNVSEATIYKLAIIGEIPAFKVMDSWWFDLKDVQRVFQQAMNHVAGKEGQSKK